MAFSGLNSFISNLDKHGELIRIKAFVNPLLEITEITDRITKSCGPALLFENTGTKFPLLINAFGSDRRMAMALGREDPEGAGREIEDLFRNLTGTAGTLTGKLSKLPELLRLSSVLPSKKRGRGKCQEVIHNDPDLGILPVLQCWPFDGGRFITLPVVHTYHPETLKTNAGMYRIQILDKNSAAMHWQMHKTGAAHYEAWKKSGRSMPVSVVLGGDPVYTYAATAPLPENIDEYILAGFLRGKRVKMVKCVTNDIYVPEDADIVIEGYVDTSEDPVWEGPFGDHTGFYSLADWYPRFHVKCITHASDAVYPATIVGIPPQEDAFLAKATEKIFLAPIRMTLQPEIEDLHMPDAGVAHNLVIVRITKSYPGQGMKVLNSLLGAGQMMFTKYIAVVSGDIDIRNYHELAGHIFENTDTARDLVFSRGPLDVLDHSSDSFALGGKLGIDATVKIRGERNPLHNGIRLNKSFSSEAIASIKDEKLIEGYNTALTESGIPLLVVSVDQSRDPDAVKKVTERLILSKAGDTYRLVIMVDHRVNVEDIFMVAWQVLGNSDPERDHRYLSESSLLIDGTVKLFRSEGFSRRWPNIVCSSDETIEAVDKKWDQTGLGSFIKSPSLKYRQLKYPGREEIING